jgi:mono/diheme cytochrome c family protein
MLKLGSFVAGALTAIAATVIGAGVFLANSRGLSAREQPGSMERWVARRARRFALSSGVRERPNPVPDSAAVLAEARAHWADHCAACHANDGSGDVEMGKRLYPRAPDMRQKDTQSMTDGELFYVIQNGVRLTGMPGWGGHSTHDELDSWKLVRFIRRLPHLTLQEEREMQALNPKSPDELKEEQEEKEFLNGGQLHEQNEHHHHQAQ